tara:strand:+ start:166 stop:480 length:315 start_codon:yes stop_codon:yes gene_type:complete
VNVELSSSDFTLDPYLVVDGSGASGPNWKHALKGKLKSLISADGKLFASTDEGYIYCFSGEVTPSPKTYSEDYKKHEKGSTQWKRFCSNLLEGLDRNIGFVIVD